MNLIEEAKEILRNYTYWLWVNKVSKMSESQIMLELWRKEDNRA